MRFRLFVSLGLLLYPLLGSSASCPLDKPLSEAEIKSMVSEGSLSARLSELTKPEDLICCLPEIYRQQYIVAPRSKSLQLGTASAPRVIMFEVGNDTFQLRRAISFLGSTADSAKQSVSPALDQTNSLEVMQFNSEAPNTSFLFTNIVFEKNLDGNFGKTNRLPFHVNIADKNCIACHGGLGSSGSDDPLKLASPRFDRDPIWPAFFGQFGFELDGASYSLSESELQAEINDLLVFQKNIESGKDTRYACLIDLKERVQCEIDLDNMLLEQGLRKQEGCKSTIAFDNELLSHRPKSCRNIAPFEGNNFFFSGLLAQANDRRTAIQITETPEYDRFRYAIVGSLVCSEVPYQMYFPKGSISKFLPKMADLEQEANLELKSFLQKPTLGGRRSDALSECDLPNIKMAIEQYLKAGQSLRGRFLLEGKRRGVGEGTLVSAPEFVTATTQSIENLRALFLGRGIKRFSGQYDNNFGYLADGPALAQGVLSIDKTFDQGMSATDDAAYDSSKSASAEKCTALVSASRIALGSPLTSEERGALFGEIKAIVERVSEDSK